MKAMMILALILLVAVGVWNSPKAAHDEGYSVVRSVDAIGKLSTIPSVMIDEGMEYQPVKTEEISVFVDDLGREVTMTSDGNIVVQQSWEREGTKEWAEWHGEGSPQWAEYTEGRVKTANEIAKRQAENNAYLPGMSMQDWQTPRSITPPNNDSPKSAEPSLWLQGLSTKISQAGDKSIGRATTPPQSEQEPTYKQQSSWYDAMYEHHPYRDMGDAWAECWEQDRKFDGLCLDFSGVSLSPAHD